MNFGVAGQRSSANQLEYFSGVLVIVDWVLLPSLPPWRRGESTRLHWQTRGRSIGWWGRSIGWWSSTVYVISGDPFQDAVDAGTEAHPHILSDDHSNRQQHERQFGAALTSLRLHNRTDVPICRARLERSPPQCSCVPACRRRTRSSSDMTYRDLAWEEHRPVRALLDDGRAVDGGSKRGPRSRTGDGVWSATRRGWRRRGSAGSLASASPLR